MPTLRLPGIDFLVSCEHASKAVPPAYAAAFAGAEERLDSHEGYDAGALQLGRELARALATPLIAASASRLLVDLNRSPGHPGLYSTISRSLPPAQRRRILAEHYEPYRRRVRACVERSLAAGARMIHFSSHSFTPELGGAVRDADLGLLYDPARGGEAALCRSWRESLAAAAPGFRVRSNYPYTGTSDGLTTALRRDFPGDRYLGIEIEVNQQHVFAGTRHWRLTRRAVIDALLAAFASHRSG